MDIKRVLCQFSCGATSAVATKLALAKYQHKCEVIALNAYVANEHEDNRRFAADCEQWFGLPLTVLRDEKYNATTTEVFKRERYMKGPRGAPCTKLLKRKLLMAIEQPGDLIVLGYDAAEEDRLIGFQERNPDRPVWAPLIEAGLTKEDCKAMIERAGIELPLMYRLGYDNANCIGCVKGGKGYWRAIREDFPEQFEELAAIEQSIGESAYLFHDDKTNKRFSLRDLGDGPVRRNERLPSCSFFCEMAEASYAG